MSDSLFDQYKETLRLGHVAARQGRLTAALLAYREAALIAPERALPHIGLGDTLRRLGRHAEALTAYSTALAAGPESEPALAGSVEALVSLGRNAEAADALDRLADLQEAAGRPDEALSSSRRALALAESRLRHRRIRRLGGTDAPAPGEHGHELGTGFVLADHAEELLAGGDRHGALAGFRAAAVAHRRDGESTAALDACYRALEVAPDDVSIHLTLAELFLERGWRAPAADKLVLLARLGELDGDPTIRERLCRLAAGSLPDEPRLMTICA
jgi:tetratricopeptide (TPR) repeat protein